MVTKVSLRNINNYQDLNRSVGKKVNFRRFYCDDYLKFGFHWTGDEQMPIARCVLFAVRSCPMKQWFQVS